MSSTDRAALPPAGRVLAVVAHPDDESFGLGAVLSTFAERGSSVGVVCLTRGEASALSATEVDLACTRQQEFQHASAELGIADVAMLDYPDGFLEGVPTTELIAVVDAHAAAADLLVVFDTTGVTGHVDHRRATEAAISWAGSNDVPVLAWTLPVKIAEALNDEFGTGFVGRRRDAIDIDLRVSRTRQMRAIECHRSQAVGNLVLRRRLELQGDHEYLRHLAPITPSTTVGTD
jgi:LmbE family N-acetylglucosaminyl deacetylase